MSRFLRTSSQLLHTCDILTRTYLADHVARGNKADTDKDPAIIGDVFRTLPWSSLESQRSLLFSADERRHVRTYPYLLVSHSSPTSGCQPPPRKFAPLTPGSFSNSQSRTLLHSPSCLFQLGSPTAERHEPANTTHCYNIFETLGPARPSNTYEYTDSSTPGPQHHVW